MVCERDLRWGQSYIMQLTKWLAVNCCVFSNNLYRLFLISVFSSCFRVTRDSGRRRSQGWLVIVEAKGFHPNIPDLVPLFFSGFWYNKTSPLCHVLFFCLKAQKEFVFKWPLRFLEITRYAISVEQWVYGFRFFIYVSISCSTS